MHDILIMLCDWYQIEQALFFRNLWNTPPGGVTAREWREWYGDQPWVDPDNNAKHVLRILIAHYLGLGVPQAVLNLLRHETAPVDSPGDTQSVQVATEQYYSMTEEEKTAFIATVGRDIARQQRVQIQEVEDDDDDNDGTPLRRPRGSGGWSSRGSRRR